ncbi:MAG: efflux RND transporter periplasmic adaptor subunit [Candidatus Hydrogenedentes bacterium]|nr:efflux RND transporter periplasmic adaptor subunit [Candidatus Hydrogenedentota bacterium]
MQFNRIRVILATLLLAAGSVPSSAQPPAPPPPDVTFVEVLPRDMPVSFTFVGVTEASRIVEIRSRVRGFLETREFEEGSLVESGARLYLIDPRPFEADLQIAKARVEQAQARLTLAEREADRLQSVAVPGAIAQSDLDKQLAEQTNAAAALNLAKAELAKAQLELGYTTIAAPLTGYVGKTLKEIGSFVDEGQNGLLTEIRQVDPIYVSYPMTEREFLRWRSFSSNGGYVLAGAEQPYIEITLLDGTAYPEKGVLDFESTTVDTRTGSVEMRATFANPDRVLKPGQFVRAHMRGYVRPGAIAIPQRAVNESPQGSYVYVLAGDNTAEQRYIEPGDWSGAEWIVESGLSAGERVLIDGLINVQPGTEVAPSPLVGQATPDAAGNASAAGE